MSETNKDALANITALFELDKARFRSLTIDVREARRRADDLLAKITAIKDAFVAAELQKEEVAKAEQETVSAPVEEVKDVAPETVEEVAPVVEEHASEPVPEVVEEKKEEQLAEVQPTSQPVKKPTKAVKRRIVQDPPMLAEAEPKQESTEPDNLPDGPDTTPAFRPSMEDPFLLAASHAQDIRSRGERLHQEIAMLMNNP